jgi:hypothetical protein
LHHAYHAYYDKNDNVTRLLFLLDHMSIVCLASDWGHDTENL